MKKENPLRYISLDSENKKSQERKEKQKEKQQEKCKKKSAVTSTVNVNLDSKSKNDRDMGTKLYDFILNEIRGNLHAANEIQIIPVCKCSQIVHVDIGIQVATIGAADINSDDVTPDIHVCVIVQMLHMRMVHKKVMLHMKMVHMKIMLHSKMVHKTTMLDLKIVHMKMLHKKVMFHLKMLHIRMLHLITLHF